jgi:ADP-heptose:LPS heptosyltransferase
MHREVAYRRSLLRVPGFLFAWLWTAWQRTLVSAAQAVLFRRIRGDEKRVAVYRIGSIGDMVHALPALTAIRRRHPDAAITLITNATGSEPWPARLGVSSALSLSVQTYASPAELMQHARAVDCLYYLAPHPLGARRALRDALFFSRAVKRATGFRALAPRGALARMLRPWREAEPQHRLLLMACGLESPSEPVSLPRRACERLAEPYAVLAAVGKSPVQHWPESRFRVLAGKLDARGLRPVWVGDEADAARLGPGLIGVPMFSGLGFDQLADLMAGASVVIANDSGLAHLAGYVGAPLVVVSSARAAVGAWKPPGERVTVLRKNMNCEACHLRECTDTKCLDLIGVDEVMTAVEKYLP